MADVIEKAVFWDDDLEPGDSWFEQIKAYIDEAPQLFVFWCDHSSTSAQVKREFQYAFHKQKRVVPVLLDDKPVPGEFVLMPRLVSGTNHDNVSANDMM